MSLKRDKICPECAGRRIWWIEESPIASEVAQTIPTMVVRYLISNGPPPMRQDRGSGAGPPRRSFTAGPRRRAAGPRAGS